MLVIHEVMLVTDKGGPCCLVMPPSSNRGANDDACWFRSRTHGLISCLMADKNLNIKAIKQLHSIILDKLVESKS